MGKEIEISIVLPCLNEEKAIGMCLDSINKVIIENKLDAEIIVVDNGSTDKTVKIAKRYGCKVGYALAVGKARKLGFDMSRGVYIFFIEASCFFREEK